MVSLLDGEHPEADCLCEPGDHALGEREVYELWFLSVDVPGIAVEGFGLRVCFFCHDEYLGLWVK